MPKTVRFIHAADLHLGAAVRGLRDLSPDWAARFHRSIPRAFDRVIEAALSREVDFVVIAGDIFDTSHPSYGEYLHFFEGIAKLHEAGIPTYMVAGNHDPFTAWARDVEQLPPTARLLGISEAEFALYEKDGEPLCMIGGRSYYNQTWPDDMKIAEGISREAADAALKALRPSAEPVPFVVGVLHTGLDVDKKKAPAAERDLLSNGVDYWACGHLHKRTVRPSAANPRIAFPGCIQGRDIKETGERGCYLVELAEAAPPEIEFIPTSSIILQQMEVRVGASQTLADLSRLVQAELFRENGKVHCDDMVVRITLTGATKLHRFLSKREIVDDLRKRINDAYPSFYCDTLVDRTTYPREVEQMSLDATPLAGSPSATVLHPGKTDPSFEGPFVSIVANMAAEQRSREDVMINYVQNEFVKRGISVPASLSNRVLDFTMSAETLVSDLLREEDE